MSQIISLEEAIEIMLILSDIFDPAESHVEMDALLCKILSSLSYTEAVEIFENISKWYNNIICRRNTMKNVKSFRSYKDLKNNNKKPIKCRQRKSVVGKCKMRKIMREMEASFTNFCNSVPMIGSVMGIMDQALGQMTGTSINEVVKYTMQGFK